MLAIEYALKYQQHVKGLVISNMMASIPAYNEYADTVQLKEFERAEDYANPRYMELLIENHYVYHVLRMPAAQWPEPFIRTLNHINPLVYIPMQGPSELGASGKLVEWDRTGDLHKITSSVRNMTPWIPSTWSGWQARCRTVDTSIVRTVVTWRFMMIRSCILTG